MMQLYTYTLRVVVLQLKLKRRPCETIMNFLNQQFYYLTNKLSLLEKNNYLTTI